MFCKGTLQRKSSFTIVLSVTHSLLLVLSPHHKVVLDYASMIFLRFTFLERAVTLPFSTKVIPPLFFLGIQSPFNRCEILALRKDIFGYAMCECL